MGIAYEWIVEEIDEHGDILDTSAWSTAEQALRQIRESSPPVGGRFDVALTRNVGNDAQGLIDRQWAYVDNGKLPDTFDGGVRVPRTKHRELARALADDVRLRK